MQVVVQVVVQMVVVVVVVVVVATNGGGEVMEGAACARAAFAKPPQPRLRALEEALCHRRGLPAGEDDERRGGPVQRPV